MDVEAAARLVIHKIKQLEPEYIVKKIIRYICFRGLSEEEIIRLALGPDSFIRSLVQTVKSACSLSPSPNRFGPITPPSSSSRAVYPMVHPYMNPQHVADHHRVPNNPSFGSPSMRGNRLPPVTGYPVKMCHYFIRGYCKHGNNCRYLHQEPPLESNNYYRRSNPIIGEDHHPTFSPGSLEKLEFEIVELLKSRKGHPVSIASLPMMYYEKYGKTLQAEGYLTESQRHGKAGYSLTKLLARLKNSIRLIDRPHGQHSVVLAEDASKYIDASTFRNEPGHIVTGSHQIYLTFPAESSFTEDDVSQYFSTFGPVQDVRIPCQQRRMFGFVTFASADTAKLVLSMGNPHYVCGARVLVKPYREKSKHVERKYLDKFPAAAAYYASLPFDIQSDLQAGWQIQRHRQQMTEENDPVLELERMRLSQLQISRRPMLDQHPCFGSNQSNFGQNSQDFNHMLDLFNTANDDNPNRSIDNSSDQDSSQGQNLPDSPFGAMVASSIAALLDDDDEREIHKRKILVGSCS